MDLDGRVGAAVPPSLADIFAAVIFVFWLGERERLISDVVVYDALEGPAVLPGDVSAEETPVALSDDVEAHDAR